MGTKSKKKLGALTENVRLSPNSEREKYLFLHTSFLKFSLVFIPFLIPNGSLYNISLATLALFSH